MYLKKLIIQGFKSFPKRTVFCFMPGITAIIGPNGSGKSNVCDAIKWVLGEQKVKSLRSNKMEDVIFNGSTYDSPSGFAEVTLIFDNSDNSIETLGEEFSITRKLYRTGESIYQINKKDCRLKDIYELLVGTGLGKNSYSVIEQGQIDRIISTLPQQKRELIEEAADITRYKYKKKEILSQLDKVEQDLFRINDLLSEIRENLHALKSQAKKAIKYKETKEKLTKMELLLHYKNFQKYVSEINKSKNKIKELENKVKEIEEKYENFGSQSEKDKEKALKIQEEYEKTKESQIKLINEIKHLKKFIDNISKQFLNIDKQKEELLEEMRNYSLEYENIANNMKNFPRFYELIDEQIGKLLGKIKLVEDELSEIETSNLEYINTLEKFQEKLRNIQNKMAECEKELAVAKTQKENFAYQENQLIQQNSRLKNRLKEIEIEKNKIEKILEKEKNENEILRKAASLDNEIRKYQEKRKELENILVSKKSKLKNIEAQYSFLKKSKENYEGFYSSIRFLLNLKKEEPDKWKKIIGVVAELIEVPKKYQIPIEVALGNALQFVITEDAETANKCIKLLKKHNLGRATFIPLDIIKTPHRYNKMDFLIRKSGIVGEALSLIKYPPFITKAMQFLLQNVIITYDLQTAIELAKKGYSLKYVSLDGELLNPSGLISGGVGRTSGLLEKFSMIDELKKQMDVLIPAIDKYKKEYLFIKSKLEKLSKEKETIEKKVLEEKSKNLQLKQQLNYLKKEESEINSNIIRLKNSLAKSFIEKGKIEEKMIKIEKEIHNLKVKEKQLRIEKAKFEEKFSDKDNILKKKMQELSNLKLELNSLKERKERTLQEEKYHIKEMERLKKDIEKLKNREKELESKKKELKGELQNLKEDIAKKEKKLSEVNAKLEKIIVEKQAVSSILEKIAEEINVLKRNQNMYQNELNEEKISLSKWETKKEDLLNAVRENYNVNLEELIFSEKELKTPFARLEREINSLKTTIENLGEVNILAIEEYEALKERYDFILSQERDLLESKKMLTKTINEIDKKIAELFLKTFESIRTYFKDIFTKMFKGGFADLVLLEPNNPLESGVDIIARPPGKKTQNIMLLSGGEKALTAISFMFALFSYKPSPFCILDEIDAPLDEYNVILLGEMLKEFSKKVQFFVITHNKRTIEIADTIYGITMQIPGESSIISMSLKDAQVQLENT